MCEDVVVSGSRMESKVGVFCTEVILQNKRQRVLSGRKAQNMYLGNAEAPRGPGLLTHRREVEI